MKTGDARQLRHALRWALESSTDPAMAAADWLALDINPSASSAIAMLTSPNVKLQHLRQAKDVYKTMRVLGETAADRRLGGRLYLAAIAAGLVVHGKRISRQNDATLIRALDEMMKDKRVPDLLKGLAGQALSILSAPGGGLPKLHNGR